MAAPKFASVRKTFLKAPITAAATELTVAEVVDIYGNELAMSDFGSEVMIVINPGIKDKEEILSATGFTRNTDNTVTIDTGVTRGRAAKSPYSTGGTARAHSAGDVVILCPDVPQLFDALIDYINEVALQGAPDADEDTAGVVEEATVAEINAGTGEGSAAKLFITPEKLESSNYGTRLPSAAGAAFLNAVTGMISMYGGTAAPTGFLLCDGTAYNLDDYGDLAAVIRDYYGRGTGTTFTAAATDVISATGHGLSDGDRITVSSTTTLPAGLSANTVYFVRDATTDTFKVSVAEDGTAVDITDTGSGTHSFYTQFRVPDMRSSFPVGIGQKTVQFSFDDDDVDTTDDEITVESNDYLHTGQAVVLSNSGGALPTGLSATSYYVIRVSATTIKLATSRANALAGVAVNITAAAGGGTHTLTLTLTDRSIGESGGEETHALVKSEIPAHAHKLRTSHGSNASADHMPSGSTGQNHNYQDEAVEEGSQGELTPYITNTGGSGAHNNVPPYVAVTYIIKT